MGKYDTITGALHWHGSGNGENKAKEKAKELVEKFIQFTPVEFEYSTSAWIWYAKQYALIYAQDRLEREKELYEYEGSSIYAEVDLWNDVITEIKKL